MTENNDWTRDDLLILTRKKVPIDGKNYTIRKLGLSDMAKLKGPIDLSPIMDADKKDRRKVATEALESATKKDATTLMVFQDDVLREALMCPRIVPDDVEPSSASEVHLNEIPDNHQARILMEVYDFSGLSKKEADKVVPL